MSAKIFHVVNSLNVGGLEQVVVNLINGLDPKSYQHVICCVGTSGIMEKRIKATVTIHAIGKGAGAGYAIPLKIAKMIKMEKPDVVHTRNWSAFDGVIAAALAGTPVIIHDEHAGAAVGEESKGRRNFFRRLLRSRISSFVPVSDELARWLRRDIGVASHKIHKIVNGVDTDLFLPATDKHAAKRAAGFLVENFVIGFVGRLDPVKNLSTLLAAFARFATCRSHARLMIVGDGPDRNNLEKICKESGIASRVVFAGERSDVARIMQAFDLFVLTSISEGIPMTVLEAMASGLPVAATDVGGVSEVVAHGETGFLVKVQDADELSEVFSRYADNPELVVKHGNAARVRAEKELSLHRMVKNYHDLYQTMLGQRRQ